MVARAFAPAFFAIDAAALQAAGEIAKNAVQYLFPPVVEPRTIAAADEWLSDAEQPPALRRLVFEGRDGIARALRARERDAATE